jgi:hypothetical protein
MRPPPGKYRIGAFKPFVPDWARFAILLLTVFAFQLSGAVYPTNQDEMVGATALTAEDLRLVATASYIGMTMAFPLLFRLKFRFMSRTILLTCGAVVIAGNVVTMTSNQMPVLLIASFITGMFRMIATFECNSSMQLVVTPQRNLSVFFCFLYIIILGSISLSGIVSAHLADWQQWQQMHLVMIAVLAAVMILLACTLRPFRFMKKMPLYRIDWFGMGMWSALLLLLNFIFEYGTRLDWFDSEKIKTAIAAAFVIAACLAFRTFTAKRPFIAPTTFRYKSLTISVFLFAAMQLLLGTTYVVMPAYTAGALRYDVLNGAALNWAVLAGVAIGIAASYYWLVIAKGGFKPIVFCGFLCLVVTHLLLLRIIAPSIPKESLYIPYAIRGAGTAMLYVSLTLYTVLGMPFTHFMQGIAVLGVVRESLGGTLANTLCTELLERLFKAHRILLGQGLDQTNATAAALQQSVANTAAAQGRSLEQATALGGNAAYDQLNFQAMLVSWKEVLGWWTLLGVATLALILGYHYGRPAAKRLPSMRQMALYLNPLPHLVRRLQKSQTS